MNRSRPLSLLATVLSLVLFAQCQRTPQGAVAVWDTSHLGASQLEARILEMEPEERRPEDGDFDTWYEELARSIATERILLDEAQRAGWSEEDTARRSLAEVRREALAEAYLQQRLPPIPPITEADVVAAYEERREAYYRPAQRRVLHIFLQRDPGTTSESLRRALTRLRQRVEEGESFSVLARTHSQSETRHRNGLLGQFRPGELNPELEQLVFDLPVRSASAPVVTAQGGHLFWVDMAMEERHFELSEVGRELTIELRRQRRNESIDELTQDYLPPEGSYLPSDEDLTTLLTSSDPQTLLLRLGTFELRLGQLAEKLALEAPAGDPWMQRAQREVARYERRERLADTAQAEAIDRQPNIASQLEKTEAVELARLWTEHRLLEAARGREESLRHHYNTNRSRYTEPLRLRLDRFRWKITDPEEAAALMARLERERNGANFDLEALAAGTAGEKESLGWIGFDQLRQRQPQAAELLAPLARGEASPPFRSLRHLEVLAVRDRKEPAERSFEAVRDLVVLDYLGQQEQALYRELRSDVLESHSFRILPTAIAALRPRVDNDDSAP